MDHRRVTVSVFRHSQAIKLPKNSPKDLDKPRELTEDGIQLAQQRRKDLGNPDFTLLVASTAPRAINTLKIIAGADEKTEVILLDELYPQGEDCDNAFDVLGYAPWMVYMNHILGKLIEPACVKMAHALLETIRINPINDDIGVGGHAVISTGMVINMLPKDHPAIPIIAAYPLGETEGYRLDLTVNGRCNVIQASVTILTVHGEIPVGEPILGAV